MVEFWSSAGALFVIPHRKLKPSHYADLVSKLKTPLDKSRNKAHASSSGHETNILENVRKLINPSANTATTSEQTTRLHPDDIEIVNDDGIGPATEEDDRPRTEVRAESNANRRRRRSQMSLDGDNTQIKMNKFALENHSEASSSSCLGSMTSIPTHAASISQ